MFTDHWLSKTYMCCQSRFPWSFHTNGSTVDDNCIKPVNVSHKEIKMYVEISNIGYHYCIPELVAHPLYFWCRRKNVHKISESQYCKSILLTHGRNIKSENSKQNVSCYNIYDFIWSIFMCYCVKTRNKQRLLLRMAYLCIMEIAFW